nr:hypothetical protein [Sterolibacterium sp.]
NRLLCFARCPAPIQASWIGYPGTTGLSSMDYFLADRFFLPPGSCDHLFTEKIVYLPTTLPFLMNEQAPPLSPLPATANGHFTFGSFNRPNKIQRNVITLWARLLRAVPDARMVLGAMTDDATRNRILSWFQEEDISPDRLTLLPRTSKKEYLAQHHQVDLCLDTFPYNGSATAGDALWMGVPTLTIAGARITSRAGAAWQRHFGLDEFIATDHDDFVQTGHRWSQRIHKLSLIRAGLRERIQHHTTCHPAHLSMMLEQALRTMWHTWCAGRPATSFMVTAAHN